MGCSMHSLTGAATFVVTVSAQVLFGLHAASQNPGWVARHVTLQFFNRMGHLVVVEVVNEGGEAPGLVLQGQRQDRNVANEYRVKEPRHFQVVAGTQRLRKQASVLQELLNDSGTSQNGG